jgi:carboxyl-terminal processing protease
MRKMTWYNHFEVNMMKRYQQIMMAVLIVAVLSCGVIQAADLLRPVQIQPEQNVQIMEFLDRLLNTLQHLSRDQEDGMGRWGALILKGILRFNNDPYTRLLDADEFENFMFDMSGTFGGVGVVISQEGDYTVVLRTIQGGPAERAGVQPGDRIIRVDGEDMVGAGLDFTSQALKGDAGTHARLVVLRGEDKRITIDIIRETIEVNTVEHRVIDGRYGYIYISLFNEHTEANLVAALKDLKSKQIQGLILDLRDNPGGLLEQGVKVASQLVPAGPVVHVVNRLGFKETYYAEGNGIPWPMVVLVNGGTASASEIVAGAVKDRQAGLILGMRTYGKGTVQSVYSLGVGGIKITMANYLTPNETSIEGKGIEPDIVAYPQILDPKGARLDTVPTVKTIKPGDSGGVVISLQRILRYLGYEIGTVDGIYDDQTQMAIEAFQADNSLVPTGIADRDTLLQVNYVLLTRIRPQGGDSQLVRALEALDHNP